MTVEARSTNIELDRDLLGRARDALGGATIKDTVEEGLRRIVAGHALTQLAEYTASRTPEELEMLRNVRDKAW